MVHPLHSNVCEIAWRYCCTFWDPESVEGLAWPSVTTCRGGMHGMSEGQQRRCSSGIVRP